MDGGLRALGRVWHESCFTCQQSGEALGEGDFYLHEGKPLSAAALRHTAPLCAGCGEPVLKARLFAMGNAYHRACFRCEDCGTQLRQGGTHELLGTTLLCRVHFAARRALGEGGPPS